MSAKSCDPRHGPPWRRGHRPPFFLVPIALGLLLVALAWHIQAAGVSSFALLILLIVALGVVLFGYVTGRFTRRLERLRRAVEAMNLQDLSARVGMLGWDSVGVLARAFDQMADRLEAEEKVRRNLFADVAHELRHPLAVLRGRLESIQDGVLPMDSHQVLLLEDDVIALSRLVDDLRDLSLAEVGRLRLDISAVDLKELVADLAADLTPVAEERQVTFTVSVDDGVPLVPSDPARIRQVLINLISNAFAHTPSGHHVSLSVRADGGGVVLSVEDTGEGISAERLSHIFERFYRGDDARGRASKGTGLGLSIVKSLVELHGGKVTVSSELGRGTRFDVWLPVQPTSR